MWSVDPSVDPFLTMKNLPLSPPQRFNSYGKILIKKYFINWNLLNVSILLLYSYYIYGWSYSHLNLPKSSVIWLDQVSSLIFSWWSCATSWGGPMTAIGVQWYTKCGVDCSHTDLRHNATIFCSENCHWRGSMTEDIIGLFWWCRMDPIFLTWGLHQQDDTKVPYFWDIL